MYWILNYVFDFVNEFLKQEDGIKQLYLVDKQCRKNLTVSELFKPHEHVEIEFTYNNKTYIHILPTFHKNHQPPIILSAILNYSIDITHYVKQYLINDLHYVKIKHIIPQKYLSIFETLEILDYDCNSLMYRNLNSTLDFLKPTFIKRRNSCDI